MYQGQLSHQQHEQGGARLQHMSQKEQEKMEAAFEQAFADARDQTATAEAQTREAEVPAEEVRETKGDLEAVWESLRPEAERLNKLAEWERDFSQVCSSVCPGMTRELNISSQTTTMTSLRR